ncbi:trinucleotide repeat-containing gene 6C protein isoform X1 [Lates japonicus]|uniref:Trinucleotide repeat-containing gene 6C protein isoform X1 n=1 Tax=Lates japonicus TaxID=270547 RepID=A0AAD3RFQ3_LATJO|nr:trinucleotide repeat-containing gene 6C protein isoform X1 [Lates japonicus]
MATGAAGQQAHYPSLKANNNMMTGPGSANTLAGNRGWGSDGKQDGINGGLVGAPNNWGSPNFNLNLNPNANPHQPGLFLAMKVVEVVVLAQMGCPTPHLSHQELMAMETWEMGSWEVQIMVEEVGLA